MRPHRCARGADPSPPADWYRQPVVWLAIAVFSGPTYFWPVWPILSLVLTLGAPTTCAPDFNCSGLLSVQDIFDFLAGWFGGC